MDLIAERRTRRRFERSTKSRRTYVQTDLGRAICGQILPPLTEYIFSEDAPRCPKGLERVVRQLPPDQLALIAVSALLNKIDTGWDPDDKSARMKICLTIGRDLRDQLELTRLLTDCPAAHEYVKAAKHKRSALWRFRRLDWSERDCVAAGSWLLDCATSLDFFDFDERGFPKIAYEHQKAVDLLREELINRHPFYLPSLKRPQYWTGWRNGSATFLQDSHPATVAEIKSAFADGSINQHADGVNALQRVPWTINERMLPVVRKFAGLKEGGGRGPDGEVIGKRVRRETVLRDVAVAKYLVGRTFWTQLRCDFRGRINPLPHFNFAREDHVRSLFLFANGQPVGDSVWWVEIAAANAYGQKGTWRARSDWVFENRELIRRVAEDPIGTVNLWKGAKDPFSLVAACIELDAAQKDPNFITRLPVLLDGSCNGIQHLALMTRDEESGRLVNLTDSEEIYDLYDTVTHAVRMLLGAADDEEAIWWLERGITRDILKQPIMTFSYGVTERGATAQIIDACENHVRPTWRQALYLAKTALRAAQMLLRRPAKAMDFMRALADYCNEANLPLNWGSPTGLPVSNRYYKPNVQRVELLLRGEPVTYRVADGHQSKILKRKAKDSAPANLVHSLDAAHLIRSINAAVAEGITDVVTVHDCYGTTAPQVTRFQQIIRREMTLMYLCYDPLTRLWEQNLAPNSLAIPAPGKLDLFDLQRSEYCFK